MKKYYAFIILVLCNSTAFSNEQAPQTNTSACQQMVSTLQTISDEIIASAEVFMPYKKNPAPENEQALAESIVQSCITSFDMNYYQFTRPLKTVSAEDKVKLNETTERAKLELAQQKIVTPQQAVEMVKIFTEHIITSFNTILRRAS
ncbi:hypothetical protein K2X40_02125 [Candidatus Babeliales bacterium]|nr:hypothetical protein [Candidatus Babeliales bacterium]